MHDDNLHLKPPAGFKLRHTLKGHKDAIFSLLWSQDGRVIASGSRDSTICLWDIETGRLRDRIKGDAEDFNSLAWAQNGRTFATGSDKGTIKLWDVEKKQCTFISVGYSGPVYSVAWSPNSRSLIYGEKNRGIKIWGFDPWQVKLISEDPNNTILIIVWSPDGQMIATGGRDNVIKIWKPKGELQSALDGHSGLVYSIAWSPDGRTIASASEDGTVRLWDVRSSKLILTLEGHTKAVKNVSFSFDGNLLASKSNDGTVRIWRYDSGENVAVLGDSANDIWARGLAFHVNAPIMATLGENDAVIRIWDLDFDVILGETSVTPEVSYTNAKVVLVGESGVGKTALGVRMTEGKWHPTTGSTHGMNVWPLYSEPEREVLLWDFAGQDEYRLVHQLFLNETNIALLLYDPTKSNDTFFGIDYWVKALKNAVPGEVQKILVAARVDVGGVRMTNEDIKAYCKAHGYIAHFATSAETNEGCTELQAAVMTAIPWTQLPRTRSPEVFKHIKDFLTDVRQGNRILVRELDLLAEFKSIAGTGAPTESEFRIVIGHVETTGLIKRLSFGDFVLLKPQLLNGYASAIVDAARRHKDGLGAVRKADVLDGRINLKDEGGLNPTDKIFLLHATVELFLRLGLALEQDGNLVFPSKFNRKMPPLEEDPVVEVEFAFEGPVENLYTTLVVKLHHGGIFRLKKLWKNAAEFLNAREHVCGFQLQNEGEGQGILKIFYAEGVRDDDKALFLKIIADHFKEKRVDVVRQRLYRCPHCRELVRDRHAVDTALKRGVKNIPCLYCFEMFPLFDALEVLYRDDEKFSEQITEMESRAEASMERGGELVSAVAELRTGNFKQWARDADIATVAIVFTDVLDSTKLNIEFGDERWRQVRESHFARARQLVDRGHGYLIKTIGDSVMAAFHSAADGLDFALDLYRETGHELVKVRVGIHIGPVEVSASDAFGQQVSLAARIEAKATDGGIWVSNQVKEDIDILRALRHEQLKWTEHPAEELKGFPQKWYLWSVEQ